MPIPKAHADEFLGLPKPGAMVNLSPAYMPAMIKGLTVHKDNPFMFDFIVDTGQDRLAGQVLKNEGNKLIKYFLASLAIPEKDLWVNLSPYEKDRTIPAALAQTDMGRDLLAQDYILKQITASLIYPEKKLGKIFWDRVYTKAREMYGMTQVQVNTFNKVWIMADRAEVFEHDQSAFVVDSHLKVMLEEDYLALQNHNAPRNDTHSVTSTIVRQIILPELEVEVNSGRNFAQLRQVYNSLILATWYKNRLKQALLNQVYSNQEKVKGIDLKDPSIKEKIYNRYLQAYKKGVFNFIKEDMSQGQMVPRKYFSGGMEIVPHDVALTSNPQVLDHAMEASDDPLADIQAGFNMADAAMIGLKDYNELFALSIDDVRLEFQKMNWGKLDQWRVFLGNRRDILAKRLKGEEEKTEDHVRLEKIMKILGEARLEISLRQSLIRFAMSSPSAQDDYLAETPLKELQSLRTTGMRTLYPLKRDCFDPTVTWSISQAREFFGKLADMVKLKGLPRLATLSPEDFQWAWQREEDDQKAAFIKSLRDKIGRLQIKADQHPQAADLKGVLDKAQEILKLAAVKTGEISDAAMITDLPVKVVSTDTDIRNIEITMKDGSVEKYPWEDGWIKDGLKVVKWIDPKIGKYRYMIDVNNAYTGDAKLLVKFAEALLRSVLENVPGLKARSFTTMYRVHQGIQYKDERKNTAKVLQALLGSIQTFLRDKSRSDAAMTAGRVTNIGDFIKKEKDERTKKLRTMLRKDLEDLAQKLTDRFEFVADEHELQRIWETLYQVQEMWERKEVAILIVGDVLGAKTANMYKQLGYDHANSRLEAADALKFLSENRADFIIIEGGHISPKKIDEIKAYAARHNDKYPKDPMTIILKIPDFNDLEVAGTPEEKHVQIYPQELNPVDLDIMIQKTIDIQQSEPEQGKSEVNKSISKSVEFDEGVVLGKIDEILTSNITYHPSNAKKGEDHYVVNFGKDAFLEMAPDEEGMTTCIFAVITKKDSETTTHTLVATLKGNELWKNPRIVLNTVRAYYLQTRDTKDVAMVAKRSQAQVNLPEPTGIVVAGFMIGQYSHAMISHSTGEVLTFRAPENYYSFIDSLKNEMPAEFGVSVAIDSEDPNPKTRTVYRTPLEHAANVVKWLEEKKSALVNGNILKLPGRQQDKALLAEIDKAAVVKPNVEGGIDLSTAGKNIGVRKEGNGVEMNIDAAMIARIKRDGIDSLTPVIYRITPVASIWPLMGLEQPHLQN